MKPGIELIAEERREQIEKHGRTIEMDFIENMDWELSEAACKLADIHPCISPPDGWDEHIWQHMINKSYKDRLVIAGALIAAEIDRIQFNEEKEEQ